MKLTNIMGVVDLRKFTNTEVHPVEEFKGVCCQIDESEWGSNPEALYYWSVFLRYEPDMEEGFGGLECVADLPTSEAATILADALERVLVTIQEANHDQA